jgi:ribosomal protein L29
MATLKAVSLRDKTSEELLAQLALEKKHLFDTTIKAASGEGSKPHEKKGRKRLIAQIQTILRERGLRRELKAGAEKLAPALEGAHPKAKSLAERPARAHVARTKLRHLRLEKHEINQPTRDAVKLAETKRRLAALERSDPGAAK